MTSDEIRSESDRLLQEISKVELYRDNSVEGKQYRSLRAEWHALKACCGHPTPKQDVDFGGGYTYCLDCHGVLGRD
jgi:hypothetical protein